MSEMLLQGFLRVHGDGAIAKLEAEYGIRAKRHGGHPNLVLFKYNQITSPFMDPMVRECRGVILDEQDDWRVISRGFDKFGNLGEGYCPEINWRSARVQEKLDGSLCVLYHYKLQWHVATSGTPDASGVVNGGEQTFAEYFWSVWGDRDLTGRAKEFCYVFELTGPLNRVVVPHDIAKLTLLTVFNKVEPTVRWGLDYGEIERVDVEMMGDIMGVDVVKEFPLSSFDECISTFETLSGLQNEGYVVVDGSFSRVKIKHPGYVALHHAKDGLGHKAFLEIARKGETAEVGLAFPEFADSVAKARKCLDGLIEELDFLYEYIMINYTPDTQKEFAAQAVLTKYPAFLFAKHGKKVASARDWVNSLPIDKLIEFCPPSAWM
jgi:hypothetical protein